MDEGASSNVGINVVDGATGDCLLGLMATGGVDPLASPTAPDGLDNGSNAPLESSAVVGLPVNGSSLLEVSDVIDAKSGGIDRPPALQSALYPLFYRGQSTLALTVACNRSSISAAAVGESRTALWESPPPEALAALPVNAAQDAMSILPAGGITKGVAQCAIGSLLAGGSTEGVAQRALGPPPSHTVVGTAELAVASLVVSPGTADCMDGCAVCTCFDGHACKFVPAAIIMARALAVANPYTTSAHGTTDDTGRVVGGAVGDVAAPSNATAATAGTAPEGDVPLAGGNVQGAHGHFMPRNFTEEKLHEADPRLQPLTATDRRLLEIFGDTIHLNNGTHLDGGSSAAMNAKYQWLYNCIVACSLPLYDLPNGRWAQRFLKMLTNLWVRLM